MKVRVLQDSAPVYPQMGADAIATRILHRGDEANLGRTKTEGPRKWVEVTLLDGSKGFMAAGTRVFSMIRATLNQPKTVLYATADSDMPAGELKKGSVVDFLDMVERDGQQRILVQDASGKQNYIDGKTPIVQKPIVTRQSALRNVLIGGALCLAGTIITLSTYTSASTSGGTYYVCWGAIIFGALQFLQGLGQLMSAKD